LDFMMNYRHTERGSTIPIMEMFGDHTVIPDGSRTVMDTGARRIMGRPGMVMSLTLLTFITTVTGSIQQDMAGYGCPEMSGILAA
jgi:hypothetical protein